jgi:hypothetical protein
MISGLLCFLYIYYLSLAFFIFEIVKYVIFTFRETSVNFFGIKIFYQHISYSEKFLNLSIILFLLSFSIFFILLVVNYKSLAKDYKNNDLGSLCKKSKKIKIGFIPFWIINFISVVFIIFHIQLFTTLIEIFTNYNFTVFYYLLLYYSFLSMKTIGVFCFLYMNLIFSSIFSIILVKLMMNNNIIQKKYVIKHILKQFLFVIDIIDTIKLVGKYEKSNVA